MKIKFSFLHLISILFLTACTETYMPKPYGYFRVDIPEHSYRTIDTLDLPYHFDLSGMAKVVLHNEKGENYWIDIQYPYLNANIYCSYKPVKEIYLNCRRMPGNTFTNTR